MVFIIERQFDGKSIFKPRIFPEETYLKAET